MIITRLINSKIDRLVEGIRPLARLIRRKRVMSYQICSLPVAEVRLRCACERPDCWGHIAFNVDYAKKFAARPGLKDGFAVRAAAIDVEELADFPTYRRRVGHQSGGNDLRSVKKARRLGYVSRMIAPDAFAAGLEEVQRSKLIRSRGIVAEALRPARASADRRHGFEVPPCAEHWRIEWGVFAPDDKLVAFAVVARTGNLLNLVHLMGHGDFLRHGVVKMLTFDLMEWVLNRQDPLVKDVRYILYGGIEDGSEGLFNWKRYLQFRPFFFNIVGAEDYAPPRDFSPGRYLKLHPDLRTTRVDPLTHYLLHGRQEGRRYK